MRETEAERKAGTVALVGRPNAGKSTLLNRLVARKVAIVSAKPQTTRHRLVGVLNAPRGQIVLFDTPGVHRPLHLMNRNMMRAAEHALGAADVVCLLVDASQPFGAGDAFVLDLVERQPGAKVVALNKIDRVRKESLLPRIERYATAGLEEIVPISALTGDGVERLLELFWSHLPAGEPLVTPGQHTLHSDRFLAAERIREKVLQRTRSELPFTTAVVIEEWKDGENVTSIRAALLVERPGQRRILIGHRGAAIKAIGTAARKDLEKLLGRRVYLDLHVRLESKWREDRRLLAELEREAFLPSAW